MLRRCGGVTFQGPKGVGKTRTIGLVNSKASSTGGKTLNLFVACKTDHAEKQAAEVGVAAGCKPLTQGRLSAVTAAFKSSWNATFAITPTSFCNLLNPGQALHDKCIATLKASGVTCIRLEYDEAHKAYGGGSSNKPVRIATWRETLEKANITLGVIAVTATPLWDIRSKAQEGQAKRACKMFGFEVGEGETPVEVLKVNTVEVSAEHAEAIFAVTKPLQTAAPGKFERPHEIAIPGGGDRSQEVAAHMEDAGVLLLGLALDGTQGHIDRRNALTACTSMAVAQKVLDTYAIEGALSEGGVACKKVVKTAGGKLALSEGVTHARSNAILVVDTPEARKYLVEQLTDRAANDEDARPMEFFDFTTKDRATVNALLAGFRDATTRMSAGHPIGIIEPSQLEGSNEFGKNVFSILAVGDFQKHLLDQGAGRLGRSVPMEAGDLVPVDGYKAVHIASKWQPGMRDALKSRVSVSKALPEDAVALMNKFEEQRSTDMKELFGEDDDTADPFLERVATTAKQLAKLDEAARLLAPHNLANAYLEAILDDKKKEEHLQKAFGKLTDDGAKRDRTESVLAKYLPSSSVASQAEEDNDNIMVDAADSSSESDEDVP